MDKPEILFAAAVVPGSPLALLRDTFTALFVARDVEATASRCHPSLTGIGTGADEWYTSLESLVAQWHRDLKQLPPLRTMSFEQISEQRYPGISLVQFTLALTADVGDAGYSFPPIRSSIAVVQTDQGWRLTHIHMSFAAVEQAEGETLPRIEELKDANRRLERQVQERTAELEAEQRKSERLLLNILPADIVGRLKETHESIAEHFDTVSVLFADIVGFTPLSQRLSPAALVGLLDTVFARFDALTDRYAVEKIKTIGDAYMVAAGIPKPCADHADRLAGLGLDMIDVVANLELDDAQLSLRIGIHSGPVVAGVIGQRKFSYDLWGDTVNTASRMESHGAPGRVQLSGATHEQLSDRFVTSLRGNIDVKGKGLLKTWWLDGRR